MAILPSNKALRSNLWAIRVKRELEYGEEATDVSSAGEFLGLVRDFQPPDSSAQLEKVRWPRHSNFTPRSAFINETFNRGSVRNWVAAYPKSFELRGGINNVGLTAPCILAYALGDVRTEVAADDIFDNHILERIVLPSFTLEATYYNQSGEPSDNLRIRYIGCKIDSLTIQANAGEPVTYSAQIIARDVKHNIAEVASADESTQQEWLGFDSALEAIEGANPLDHEFGQDLYYFSAGKVEIYEPADSLSTPEGPLQNPTYGRINNFTLSINNNLSPEYYLQNLNTYGDPTITELVEGDREYKLQVNANPDDQDFFRLLMQYGYYGAERRGYGIRIRYDRTNLGGFAGNDFIELRMPANTKISSRNWDAFGYPTGPVAGFESSDPVLGCFLVSGPHNVRYENPLVEAPLEFEVPSLDIMARNSSICLGFSSDQTTEPEPPEPPEPFDVPFWAIYGATTHFLRRGSLDRNNGTFIDWEIDPVDTTVYEEVTAIAAHPTNKEIVFWAVTDAGASSPHMQLFRYNGTTVDMVLGIDYSGTNSSNSAINSIWVEEDGSHVWCTVGLYSAGTGNYAIYPGLGVYRSTDGGDTWAQVVGNGVNVDQVGFEEDGKPGTWDICVKENSPRRIFIVHPWEDVGVSSSGRLSYSDDEGATWVMVAGANFDSRRGIVQGFPFGESDIVKWSFNQQDAQRVFYEFDGSSNVLLLNTSPQGLAARGGHFYSDSTRAYFPAQIGNNFAGSTSDNWSSAAYPSGWAGENTTLIQKTSIHATKSWMFAMNNLSGLARITIDYGANWDTIALPEVGHAVCFVQKVGD